MSTRDTTFSFRGIEDMGGGASLEDVRTLLAGPEPAALLPPGTIGTQSAGQGSGIPMSAIRRGLLGPLRGRTSGNYAPTSTSFTELDPALLAGTLVCTGRPVRIDLSAGVNVGTSTGIILSAMMDGAEVTGSFDGMAWLFVSGDLFLTGWTIVTPRPGPRRFAFAVKLNSAGTGTVYSNGAIDIVQFAVTEL